MTRGETSGTGAGAVEASGSKAGAVDPVRLEIFRQLLASVAEEMGTVLRRTGHSPNIKERRDFSCAVFDPAGEMVAQAAHIPVHLGAMPLSVRACLDRLAMEPGDVAILNDPFRGGTHLPDVTLVSPVHADAERAGFVASRAHHADIGGMSPGSMPLSREIYQEGLVIPPLLLCRGGEIRDDVWRLIMANVRTPEERAGDLRAQIAANARGTERLAAVVERHGRTEVGRYMEGLRAHAARLTRELLRGIPDGAYEFSDRLDDDGTSDEPVEICVRITVDGERARVDFTGSSAQRPGGVNAVRAIAVSATQYVFRCLLGEDAPSNSGGMEPVEVVTPEGTVVNARRPAGVAAGNVETSQRITDVLLGALAAALPDRIPAASQGTMNNVTVGGHDLRRDRPYAYYETVGGGAGGVPGRPGASGIHTHMTNTLNTPVEALEYAYPFRVRRYEIRRGSGGDGEWPGGDGVCRELEFLGPARLSLLTERRRFPPYGLRGGAPGRRGHNLLRREGAGSGEDAEAWNELPGKCTVEVGKGAVLRLETPGGGGHGTSGSDAPGTGTDRGPAESDDGTDGGAEARPENRDDEAR